MKFIHIADMHLDQPFEGLGKLPNSLLAKLVEQNGNMLNQVVNTAIKEAVDFILIVGDTFHQSIVTIHTQQLLISNMKKLQEAQIPVVLSFGNHDYYRSENFWFEFPDNVILLTDEKVSTCYIETKKQEKVAISGFSYQERWLNTSKVSQFPVRDSQSHFHIGMYHGQQGNDHSQQQYAPFTVSEMKAKGYDYWALGHIHQPTVISQDPLMIYPGSPLGHTKKESNSLGFVIVEHQREGLVHRWSPLNQVTWTELKLDLEDVTTLKELLFQLLIDGKSLYRDGVIQLVKVRLVGKNEGLESALDLELANGGILSYLQEELSQLATPVWAYDIKRQLNRQPKEFPLGITPIMIEKLNQSYLDEETFNSLMTSLYRQADMSRLLELESSTRQVVVEAALAEVIRELAGGKR